jgi:hypothetical protein
MTNIDKHKEKTKILDELIKIGLEETKKDPKNFSKNQFHKLKNEIYKKYKISKPFQSIELIERYEELIAD